MQLSNLKKTAGNKSPKKRVGRGGGSGKGFHTTGTGNKGQNSRRGHGIPTGFEGGQVPLYKKLPKIKGFKRSYQKKPVVINLFNLNVFEKDADVNPQTLFEKKLITKSDLKREIKILGHGELKNKLNFSGVSFSKSVAQAIKNA